MGRPYPALRRNLHHRSTTKGTTTTLNAKLTGTGAAPGDTDACTLAWRVYGGNYATAAAHYDQLLFGKAVSSLTGLNTPGLLDDLGPTPRTGDEVLNTPKLDWQISPTEHVSALFHRLRWDSPGGVQTQTSNTYATDTFGTDFVKLDYGLVKLDSLLTSSSPERTPRAVRPRTRLGRPAAIQRFHQDLSHQLHRHSGSTRNLWRIEQQRIHRGLTVLLLPYGLSRGEEDAGRRHRHLDAPWPHHQVRSRYPAEHRYHQQSLREQRRLHLHVLLRLLLRPP